MTYFVTISQPWKTVILMIAQWAHVQEWPCWQGWRLVHRLSNMDFPSPRLTYWVPDPPTAETRDQYWALIWALSGRLLTLDPFYHGKDSNLLSLEKTHYLGLSNCHGIAKEHVLTYPPTSSSLWWLRSWDVKDPHAQVSFREKLFIFSLSHRHLPMLRHSSVRQFWATRGSGGAFKKYIYI